MMVKKLKTYKKPCEWGGGEFPQCNLLASIELPTCPSLIEHQPITNGEWDCTSDIFSEGESCFFTCDDSFRQVILFIFQLLMNFNLNIFLRSHQM